MTQDEGDRRPAPGLGETPLERLSVGELEAYVVELRREIARAQAAIKAKRDTRAAAEALFKPRGGE